MNWWKSLVTREKTKTAQGAPTSPAQEERSDLSPKCLTGMFVGRASFHGNNGLYLLDQRGSIVGELARDNPLERIGNYAVSPDGRWVAYTCHVQRREDRDRYPLLRVAATAGNASTDLTRWDPQYETCYQNPVFSPDGHKLVCEFGLRDAYNPDLRVLELFEVGRRLAGSGALSIVNPLHIGNHAPIFAPDGSRIIYFGNFAYEDLLEVCLYDPKVATRGLLGEVGWRLTENADGVWRRPRAIAFQPQWEQIFFIQGHTRGSERICSILLPDLSPDTHLKQFESVGGEYRHIGALEMSTDGLWLAYDADHAIYLVGADGSKLRRISKEGSRCHCPRVSKLGDQIAFIADNKLCITDQEGSQKEILGSDDYQLTEFVWI